MRPVRLRLAGFTAFRDEQDLDFEGLDLFAITGPTGAGKSSLLDAVTYALYGKAPRVGKGVGALISQGQPRLRVQLDFDVDGTRYRVTRSTPSSGTSTILLERKSDDGWESFGEGADRINECNKLITTLVGLDFEAFTRSVLLPQGQFAEFLKGDPKERRAILTELLGLELFGRMAARSREIAAASRAVAEAKTDLLHSQFAGVDADAVKEATEAATGAKALSEAVAAAESQFESMAKRWRQDLAEVEALDRLSDQAAALARSAGEVASGLDIVAEDLAVAERDTVAAEERAALAARTALEARKALGQNEARWGTLEDLAGQRAGMDELARIQGRLRLLEEGLEGARRDQQSRAAAIERIGGLAQAAEEEMTKADTALREAVTGHDRASHSDLVGALTRGLAPGDPCPVCSRPLAEVPRSDRGDAAVAAKRLEGAQRAAKRAEAEWSGNERDLALARRDEESAATATRRAEQDLEACRTERDELGKRLVSAFGDHLPEDPVAAIDGRMEEIRDLARKASECETAASQARAESVETRQHAAAVAGRGATLVGLLRGMAVPALVEASTNAVEGLAIAAALNEDVPSEPEQAGALARAWAEGTAVIGAATSARSGGITSRIEAELDRARDGLPEAVKVPARADVDDVLETLRHRARELVADATAAQKDAERLIQQLKERKALEKDVKARSEEANLYGALAQEFRADRLIDFLQGEALEILAEAGSERLSFLSRGRYRLAFEEDEFSVEDRQNGDERRSVRTLSGGETFLASLALALALAEQIGSLAVTPKARLESLFIDEGFGALDPESLEVATEALSQLGGEDRMVGVITHVRELADRMPVQIRVEREARGSRLTSV
jgi:DNA repair protein SbcC/Rad50